MLARGRAKGSEASEMFEGIVFEEVIVMSRVRISDTYQLSLLLSYLPPPAALTDDVLRGVRFVRIKGEIPGVDEDGEMHIVTYDIFFLFLFSLQVSLPKESWD